MIHGLGICLIIVTFVAALLLPPPPRMWRPILLALVYQPVLVQPGVSIPDARVRASPAWLERFLN